QTILEKAQIAGKKQTAKIITASEKRIYENIKKGISLCECAQNVVFKKKFLPNSDNQRTKKIVYLFRNFAKSNDKCIIHFRNDERLLEHGKNGATKGV